MRRALLALLIGTAALGATAGPHCPVTAPEGTAPLRRGGETAPRRAKRFAAAVQRHVELLVVADAAMARFHGTELRPYLLTVLATAARTFRHGSLGAAVQLRLTRLLVLANGAPGPSVTSNAAQTLRDFCRWQRDLNVPDEDSPLHFDVAVLFTRQDLCGAATCDTLGMAVGDVHYTVHRTLAQSHPQQLWSRSPLQPLTLWMDGAYGEEWEDKPSCLSHLSVQSRAYHAQLHHGLDSKGPKSSNSAAGSGSKVGRSLGLPRWVSNKWCWRLI